MQGVKGARRRSCNIGSGRRSRIRLPAGLSGVAFGRRVLSPLATGQLVSFGHGG